MVEIPLSVIHNVTTSDGLNVAVRTSRCTLDYCEYCRSPDGRVGTLELWQRDGADPVELLSAWEREQLEQLLARL
ncbi:DUF7693 family protein [Pseudomonas silesiensis]|uniref:DUF7693 family protein n=1 Tax=Pseudomonas silesiensis TaxID=1853130 RepID=UPI0009EE69D3